MDKENLDKVWKSLEELDKYDHSNMTQTVTSYKLY